MPKLPNVKRSKSVRWNSEERPKRRKNVAVKKTSVGSKTKSVVAKKKNDEQNNSEEWQNSSVERRPSGLRKDKQLRQNVWNNSEKRPSEPRLKLSKMILLTLCKRRRHKHNLLKVVLT
jgi:hypothetical protein